MVNIFFDDDPDQVICELQLIHHTLMLARKGMNGHNDYVTYRSGMELQQAVGAAAWPHGTEQKQKDTPSIATDSEVVQV